MSYILDALRRAEADRERERGQVPGLHAQPPAGGAAAVGAALSPRRGRLWAAGGAVVVLLLVGVGVGSWWAGGSNPADVPVSGPVGQLPQQQQRAETPPLPAVAGTAATLPASAPTSTPIAVPTLPPPPLAAPAPVTAPPITAPPVIALKPSASAPVLAAKASAPTEAAPIPRLAELPESLRRELPKLAISGSVYSEDPASRFVIANGEVLREGAKLGPEHVLEQIGTRELVLRFKGQRYRQAL
jgi:general secretion pathway protein B